MTLHDFADAPFDLAERMERPVSGQKKLVEYRDEDLPEPDPHHA